MRSPEPKQLTVSLVAYRGDKMYEGNLAICKDIVEANWLEFLAYAKQISDKQIEQQKLRQEALKGIEGYSYTTQNTIADAKLLEVGDRRYYDISLSSFWNWYIENKLQA